jgi:hypothetical protein
MIKVEDPTPADWTVIVIHWDDILQGPEYDIMEILKWVDEADGGHYNLLGYNATDGFEFHFERPEDAVLMKLKWL